MGKWVKYYNGNYVVYLNTEDGTKIRRCKEKKFVPEFPESIDLNISNRCYYECPFCYQGCSPAGEDADLSSLKFLDTLHPYTELAININTMEMRIIPFLERMKKQDVIVNATLNQFEFVQQIDAVRYLVGKKLIHGIGVSLVTPTDEFIELAKEFKNLVIHTIVNIHSIDDYRKLMNHGLKVLILGYKHKGRGLDYSPTSANKEILRANLDDLYKGFEVVSFDNLAIQQLQLREMFPKETWDTIYMGDDGEFTFFIDAVSKKYGVSSLQSANTMWPITDNVDEMFAHVRAKSC